MSKGAMATRSIRFALMLSGFAGLALACGFFVQAPSVTSLWPLPAGRLSNIFVASILAAAAAPVIWIGLCGEARALAGGAFNFAVTYAGIALLSLLGARGPGPPELARFGAAAGGTALLCAAIFVWSGRIPFSTQRPTPLPVRLSFGFFAAILAAVGSTLVLKRSHVFPWPISEETSVIYGWVFLGAMCYFVYGLIVPVWRNAQGPLLGFLAYDLVLIVPYVEHFRTVRADLRLNLAVYVAVIVYSAVLAAYYLFVHRETRFQGAGGRCG